MYVIGLTGNIATGKSTVADMLARLGACVLDADKLAHQVMRPGTETYRRIVGRFGEAILKPGGEIDRPALGAIVFADPAALRDLDGIVHPAVVEESLRWLQACDRPVAVIEAIKLLEANMHRYCDAVWVVTSSREQQVNRLVTTRSLTTEQAEQRIDAQPDPQEKIARADVVIDNSGSLDATRAQVLRAWNAIPGVPQATDIPKEKGGSRP
ncbi:MAG: dephospho-CoA kinase [Chloroflexi bacterium]|jgi:dephospho-CoA kinase|nr:dephospho-CoA kinase [Chloroflexota bacterium]